MPLNLDYFYGGEAEQYTFYRIPKALFTDEHYKGVPVEAKVLYGLLLDRMSLSIRNGWLDPNQRVYIFFTLEDAMEQMNCGHNKAVKVFSDLEKIGLIERKKQGLGKPSIIYVKNFIIPSAPAPIPSSSPPPDGFSAAPAEGEVQTSEKRKSGLPAIGTQDFRKTNANKTENNKTEFSDTDPSFPPSPPVDAGSASPGRRRRMRMDEMDEYRELIRENIDYDILLGDRPYDAETIDGYVELMVEVCCTPQEYTRIGSQEIPTSVVKSRFLKLTSEHIIYVMDSLKANTTLVKNIRAYTLTALYNAPLTMNQYYASLVSHDMARGAI